MAPAGTYSRWDGPRVRNAKVTAPSVVSKRTTRIQAGMANASRRRRNSGRVLFERMLLTPAVAVGGLGVVDGAGDLVAGGSDHDQADLVAVRSHGLCSFTTSW